VQEILGGKLLTSGHVGFQMAKVPDKEECAEKPAATFFEGERRKKGKGGKRRGELPLKEKTNIRSSIERKKSCRREGKEAISIIRKSRRLY